MGGQRMTWWRVNALIEADSSAEAIAILRREGAVVANRIVYADGRVVLQGIREAETPWRPSHSAPTDGRPFIGFNNNIRIAETIRWSEERRLFLDEENREAHFTHWMQMPE
jgi:hypothetical protein